MFHDINLISGCNVHSEMASGARTLQRSAFFLSEEVYLESRCVRVATLIFSYFIVFINYEIRPYNYTDNHKNGKTQYDFIYGHCV